MGGYLTLEEAAERLGVEYKTIYRLVRSGDLSAGKVGRIYRIREEDLNAYFDRQKQLLAEQTKRTGLTALEGRICAACDKPILSELSIAGACDECGRDICQACWVIRKIRKCQAHAEAEPAAAALPAAQPTIASLGKTARMPSASAPYPREDPTATIKRLRDEGRTVITPPDIEPAAGSFLRAFAQRLEAIEELPDPLNRRTLELRKARVTHTLEPVGSKPADRFVPRVSRFALRAGGWGRPKSALVLEARFLLRPETLAACGYDAEPLGDTELGPVLADLRERAKKDDCFHASLLASAMGWSEAARKLITHRQTARAFHDRRVGVALCDLPADATLLDEKDDRLWAFWPLLAPAQYGRELARCVETVRDLVTRHGCVSLKTATEQCRAAREWVRAAFAELVKQEEFVLEELPKVGLAIARRRL